MFSQICISGDEARPVTPRADGHWKSDGKVEAVESTVQATSTSPLHESHELHLKGRRHAKLPVANETFTGCQWAAAD